MTSLTAAARSKEGLEAQLPSGGGYLSAQLVRYVDPIVGNNSNKGLSQGLAFKSIQTAYEDLRTVAEANFTPFGSDLGVGRIILLPGDHDVGTGLEFDNTRPVELLGTRSGAVGHAISNSASRLISSSKTVTEFVKCFHATSIAHGFVFNNVAFKMDHTVNTALEKIIHTTRVDNLVVDRCSFDNADNETNVPVTAIHHEGAASNNDTAWFRVTNNNCSRLQFFKAVTGTAFNRARIRDNVVFYGYALPMVHLDADFNGLTMDGNNLEGSSTAVELGPLGAWTQCTFMDNSGEDPSSGTPPNPFYNFAGSVSQSVVIGGVCLNPSAGGYGVWINFGANAYRNIVIGTFDLTNVTKSVKRKIVETSHPDGNLLIPSNAPMTTYTAANPVTNRALNVVPGVVATQRKMAELTAATATTVFSPGEAVKVGERAILCASMNAIKEIEKVEDSVGNTWVKDATKNDGTRALSFFSCPVTAEIKTGSTITITWTSATSGAGAYWLIGATNLAASPFDKSASGEGTSATPATSATEALTQGYELVLALTRTTYGTKPDFVAGTGFGGFTTLQSTITPGNALEYELVDAPTAVVAGGTWGGSGTWVALVATYKAATTSGAAANISATLGTLIADLRSRGMVK